ncbi:hypothetical protein AB0J72_34745 [Dactylosporangium sp. NPDC049742]|uniref:hypothetical protein n=1 Tax=Dactylosporangium sp. NPDC049742 TaxID=3154737 RepID=UPI0034385695
MRRYEYVGPAELRDLPPVAVAVIRSRDDLAAWLAARPRGELAEPFTFVVDLGGTLRLAPRRSEHIACAGGEPVLAAGEMGFAADWRVDRVSNQSTGYCPDPACWPAVAAALDAAGTPHPGGFTDTVVFRRCTACGQRNIVHDGDFACAVCGAPLPVDG